MEEQISKIEPSDNITFNSRGEIAINPLPPGPSSLDESHDSNLSNDENISLSRNPSDFEDQSILFIYFALLIYLLIQFIRWHN